MTETSVLIGTPKVKSLKVKAKSAKKAHPPTASLVNNAIKHLNERGGSSLQAIKKYISGTYKIDGEKIAPLVKKYLKSAVDKGVLIRTKGTGASGSFKLAAGKVQVKAAKKAAPKPKKVKKVKSAKPKKAKKAPSKAKKATKAPAAKKPKAPKPKKAAPKKVAKKVVAKK